MALIDLDLDTLPTLSPLAPTLLGLMWDVDDALPRLMRIVESDPFLEARLIGMANSVAYGVPGTHFSDAETAVQRIGLRRSIQLATAILFGQPFDRRLSDDLGRAIWLHALTMAYASDQIAKAKRMTEPHSAYFHGLVHDLGYMAMEYLRPGTLVELAGLAAREGLSPEQAETRSIGDDHAGLTARLLARWHVPGELLEPLRAHHSPTLDVNSMAAILAGAEVLMRVDEIETLLYANVTKPFAGSSLARDEAASFFERRLGLSWDALDRIARRVAAHVEGLLESAG